MINGLKVFNPADKVKVQLNDNVIQGFKPAEYMFGYTYHAHAVPPFKPESMLMLGYGFGTVAELSRKVWGADVKITGIDIEFPNPPPYFEYKLICKDAFQFVKDESKMIPLIRYDYIAIDIYDGGIEKEFIFDERFVDCIEKLSTSLVSINICSYSMDRLKPYYDKFEFDRASNVGNQLVVYWRKHN